MKHPDIAVESRWLSAAVPLPRSIIPAATVTAIGLHTLLRRIYVPGDATAALIDQAGAPHDREPA